MEQPRGSTVREPPASEQEVYVPSTEYREPEAPPPPTERNTSGLAIASLVVGIASYLVLPFLGAIAALILGYAAKDEIRKNPLRLKGDDLATAGIVLGWVQLGLIALAIILVILAALLGIGLFGSVTGTAAAAVL
ncbi:MAG: DUF4190 domain-containing protein [Anaerolineae bacterium]